MTVSSKLTVTFFFNSIHCLLVARALIDAESRHLALPGEQSIRKHTARREARLAEGIIFCSPTIAPVESVTTLAEPR